MWFKNLQIYTLPQGWAPHHQALEVALARHPLLPVNQASMSSQGWVPPGPGAGLLYTAGMQQLVALGTEQRMLPASVVNEAVKVASRELEAQQGFAPGRKQLRDIKDAVIDDLRPRAFVRRRTVRAWLDFTHGRIIVDTPSPAVAEDLLTVLRADLGELPALPLDTRLNPSATLTCWVAGEHPTRGLALSEDCELLADNPTKAAVRYARHSLDGPELRSLINGGKLVAQLGLSWRERLSFVIAHRLAIKRVRFIDITEDKAGSRTSEDAFDVDFELMTRELSALIGDLVTELGGVRGDHQAEAHV